jgi:uncharacterized protein YaiI (UPF0178 family)
MSKRNQAIEIMKANATLDMAAVVLLIAKAIDVSEANARSYYRYIVQNGLADGKVVAKAKAEKAVTKGRDSVNKAIAKQFAKQKAKDAATEKTLAALEDLQAIKEKNLQTLREATAKRKAMAKLHAKVREEHEAEEAEAAKEDPRDFVPKFLHKELGLL